MRHDPPVGFWFDQDEIDKQAEVELKEEHFRRMVDARKAYLDGKKLPWWSRMWRS